MSALLLLMALVGVSPPSCAEQLTREVKTVEKAAPAARAAPALRALGTCTELGPLAVAATQAAAQPRAQRERSLVAASGLGAECAAQRCAKMPAPLEMAPQALADVDAGSYAFAIAVHAALTKAGAWSAASERVLLSLLLGSALEGAARR